MAGDLARFMVTLTYDYTVISTTVYAVDEADAESCVVSLLADDLLASRELLGMFNEIKSERMEA